MLKLDKKPVDEEIVDEAELVSSAVIYTDGGARTNPGCIGYGVHGYIYTVAKKASKAELWYISDKGYVKSRTEDTVDVAVSSYIDMVGSSTLLETNNRAELKAAIAALKYLSTLRLHEVYLYTDSDYVNKGSNEWLEKWIARGYKRTDGSIITNVDLWKEMKTVLDRYTDTTLHIQWIKAHNGNLGNEEADSLATIGNNKSLAGIDDLVTDVSDPVGYWKPLVARCPMLGYKRVYFNSLPDYNTPGCYYQAEPGVKDEFVGKRVPEASYSILKLIAPDVILEDIIKKQYDVTKLQNGDQYNGIFVTKVDVAYNKKVLKHVMTHRDKALTTVGKSFNLNAPNNDSVTVELNPTGLCMRAINNFTLLEELLDLYIDRVNGEPIKKDPLETQILDVTDTFFEVVTKKKQKVVQLLPTITTATRDFILPVEVYGKKLSIPVCIGRDILDRNNLKKLETHSPRVSIVVWKSAESVIKYAFIIDCQLGRGIWSNYFADTIYLSK